jgi:hypothetical protein
VLACWLDSSGSVLLNTVTKLWVPWNVENFLTSWAIVSFSRRNVLDLTFYRHSFRISAETPAVLPEASGGFCQFLQGNPGKVSWLTRDGFLPSTFQFTIYQSYHPTLCSLGTDSIIKLPTDESGPWGKSDKASQLLRVALFVIIKRHRPCSLAYATRVCKVRQGFEARCRRIIFCHPQPLMQFHPPFISLYFHFVAHLSPPPPLPPVSVVRNSCECDCVPLLSKQGTWNARRDVGPQQFAHLRVIRCC